MYLLIRFLRIIQLFLALIYRILTGYIHLWEYFRNLIDHLLKCYFSHVGFHDNRCWAWRADKASWYRFLYAQCTNFIALILNIITAQFISVLRQKFDHLSDLQSTDNWVCAGYCRNNVTGHVLDLVEWLLLNWEAIHS